MQSGSNGGQSDVGKMRSKDVTKCGFSTKFFPFVSLFRCRLVCYAFVVATSLFLLLFEIPARGAFGVTKHF